MTLPALQYDDETEFRRLRDRWLAGIDVENKLEHLFELESALKALDRFFNIENLPILRTEQVISRDFSIEIRVIAKACRDIARLARILLKEEAGAFTFQSYLENSILGDRARDAFTTRHLNQENPAESLYVLGAAFQNFADTTEALTRLNTVSFALFESVGQLISRAIAMNRFFNPMAGDHFDPAHDKMKSAPVAKVVRGIGDRDLRRHVSISVLALFRLLRYLDTIEHDTDKRDELRQALLMLALVHSESRMLIHFFENESPAGLRDSSAKGEAKQFVELADSLAFQFDMELRKVFRHVLRDALGNGSVARVRSSVTSAIGILRNFFEQSIVLIIQSFDEATRGRQIFPGFVSKVEQSTRLREDIWVLNKICDSVEQSLSNDAIRPAQFLEALQPLNQFVDYFLNLSFKFVRHSDHDEFERFFMYLKSIDFSAGENAHKLADFRKRIGYFNRFVETTLGHIRHRQELQDLPLDTDHARAAVDQFLG